MVECERSGFLNSGLREHWRRHHHCENCCRAQDLESGHSLVSPFIDPLRDSQLLRLSASADVQTLVELLIKLLLLGIEYRHLLLLGLLRRRTRRKRRARG